jgi:superfamily II DNA or RNA helicase
MTRDEIQQLSLDTVKTRNRSGLGLATGVGKTRVGLRDLSENCPHLTRALVVAPKKSIHQEWKDEAIKMDKPEVLENLTFTTYLSLNKIHPEDYDIIYLDECHSLLYTHREFLDKFQGRILGLTGTPPRFRNSEKGEMVAEYCPIVYEYFTDDAVEDKILNDYKIIVHELELNHKNDIEVNGKTGTFYTSEVKNYAYWCNRLDNASTPKSTQIARIMRMKALMDFSSKERYTKLLADSIKSKCVIFANTQEQADKLCTHSYHSNNTDSENNLIMFKAGNINKLSCVLQLSEGVNIPDLKQGIIMHAYGNERKSSQRIGRMLRLNPDDVATIHILCYVNTIDKDWVREALKGFDDSKITWKNFNINVNED